VSLTAEGVAMLPRVQRALEELERAVDDARADRLAGPLRVSMLTSFLHQWLLPRLQRFRDAHPQIDLHIHTGTRTVDFVREEFHAAIRFGNGQWPGLSSELLLDEWLIPVCTPALLDEHGPLRDHRDLRRYPLLHSTTEPWTDWPEGGSATGAEGAPASGSAFDDSVAIVRSAVQGHGLALARWSLVADEVAGGALVVASPRVVKFRRSYWIVSPARAQASPALRAFHDWLAEEAARYPRPPGTGQRG
jgi:LysR family glycine cleavage system transcriptional activator